MDAGKSSNTDTIIKDANELREASKPFVILNKEKRTEFIERMKITMINAGGVGLSACQIGERFNIFIVGDPKAPETIEVFANPNIVYRSPETNKDEEGCLSFPGLFLPVKRSNWIRVRYNDESGAVVTKRFDGMTARIIQHEYDHLLGVTFQKKASFSDLERARKKRKKLLRDLSRES